MNVLFVMDPLERIHSEKDTTYLLIREALRRKLCPFFCGPKDLFFQGGEVSCRAHEVLDLKPDEQDATKCFARLAAVTEAPLSFFRLVFMRKDPPFDLHFLTACYLLDLARHQTMVVNRPRSLKIANEKLYALHFKHLCPETLVSSQVPQIRRFLGKLGGKAVLKPIFRCGGEGVFLLQEGDPNLNVILETSLAQYPEGVVIQAYLPEVRQGDKRIIVLDGEPVGALLRVSPSVDVRSNIHVGGQVFRAEITARDREICNELKPTLVEMGLFLVGLDVIGNFLTEINVTSPTGFQEINRLQNLSEGKNLEALTFDRLLAKLNGK